MRFCEIAHQRGPSEHAAGRLLCASKVARDSSAWATALAPAKDDGGVCVHDEIVRMTVAVASLLITPTARRRHREPGQDGKPRMKGHFLDYHGRTLPCAGAAVTSQS